MFKKKSKKEDSSDEEAPLEIKKTGLIIGILLSFGGIIGVLGLRAGFIQSLLGDAAAYPGIGTAEPIGHIVSVIPTVLGLVMIMSWGIKNDSIYYELEKLKKEDSSDEIEEDLPKATIPTVPSKVKDEPEDEIEEDEIEDIPADIEIPSEFKEPIKDIKTKALDEFDDVLDDIAKEVDKKGPTEVSKSVKNELAEQVRVERCEKILMAAPRLPEDKKKLKALVPTGISAAKFTKEIKAAIDRKKKHDKEKKAKTADEKASVLEDELVAELAELEDELEDGMDRSELEDQIFKELEDLENF